MAAWLLLQYRFNKIVIEYEGANETPVMFEASY